MTVEELIEKLKLYPENMEVFLRSDTSQHEFRSPCPSSDNELINIEWVEYGKNCNEPEELVCTSTVKYYDSVHCFQKNKPFKAVLL